MAKILHAEDDRHIGDLLEFKLTNAGYELIRVRDGEEALRAASREKPDLILLDVMMPVLNGFDVLRKLKEDPALEGIPVIMLTAKNEESDVLWALSAGADDYIVKPFSVREVLARIDRLMRRRGGSPAPSGAGGPRGSAGEESPSDP
jgi:DNA-binding response OmpR family regulator